MEHDRIIELLRSVPETRLRIIDITWKVIGPDGEPDMIKSHEHQLDMNLAIAEATYYCKSIHLARSSLRTVFDIRRGMTGEI